MAPKQHQPRGLARRLREPERMDDPSLGEPQHRAALAGLARLNRVARGDRLLWRALRGCAQPGRPLFVLDLGCGGADPALALQRRAARAGVELRVLGADLSSTALSVAAEGARRAGVAVSERAPEDAGPLAPGLSLCRCDVVAAPPAGRYDVVMCSLFLHHLPEASAVQLLGAMRERASQRAVVHDLRRSPLGFGLAAVASRLLSRSPVVHFDATASVRAAFSAAELGELAARAGMRPEQTHVRRSWPERLVLEWSPA